MQLGKLVESPDRSSGTLYGKDAGHRLSVRTRWLQAQDVLTVTMFWAWEPSASYAQIE